MIRGIVGKIHKLLSKIIILFLSIKQSPILTGYRFGFDSEHFNFQSLFYYDFATKQNSLWINN